MAEYLQEIIEDALVVGQLTGYTPQFILHSVSNAIKSDRELAFMAETWARTQETLDGQLQ